MKKDPKATEEKRVFMRCRNHPKCDSIEVIEMKYAAGARLYRCTKCNHTRVITVGGKMDVRSL